MLSVTIEFNLVIEGVNFAIHAGARKTSFANFFKDSLISSLTGANQRRKDQRSCAIGELPNAVYNLLRRLFHDLSPANGAVWYASPGKQQTHVVVDFSNRA